MRQLDGPGQEIVEGLAGEKPRERVDLALFASGLELLAEPAHLGAERLDARVVVLFSLLENGGDGPDDRHHLALQVGGRFTERQGLELSHLRANPIVAFRGLGDRLVEVLNEDPDHLPQIGDHAARVRAAAATIVANELAYSRPVALRLGARLLHPGRRRCHQRVLRPLLADGREGRGVHLFLVEGEFPQDAQDRGDGVEGHLRDSERRGTLCRGGRASGQL